MGLGSLATGAIGLGVKGAWNIAKRPVVGGAVIGGLTGYFNGQYSDQGRFEDALSGAAQGAIGGFLLDKVPGLLWKGKGALAQGAWSAAKTAAKAGRFAFEHPGLMAGAAGVAWGASALMNRDNYSPTLRNVKMNTSVNQQAAAADELSGGMGMLGTGQVGAGQQMLGSYYRNLALSTPGVVQGLHRSRHG